MRRVHHKECLQYAKTVNILRSDKFCTSIIIYVWGSVFICRNVIIFVWESVLKLPVILLSISDLPNLSGFLIFLNTFFNRLQFWNTIFNGFLILIVKICEIMRIGNKTFNRFPLLKNPFWINFHHQEELLRLNRITEYPQHFIFKEKLFWVLKNSLFIFDAL